MKAGARKDCMFLMEINTFTFTRVSWKRDILKTKNASVNSVCYVMECAICYLFMVVKPIATNNTCPRAWATPHEGLKIEVRASCSFTNISPLCEA